MEGEGMEGPMKSVKPKDRKVARQPMRSQTELCTYTR